MSGLTAPQRALAERLLRHSSVARVTEAMRSAGEAVSYGQVDTVRRAIEKRGDAVPKERSHTGPAGLSAETTPIGPDESGTSATRYSCDALLAATMCLIRRRAHEMRCDVVTAGLRLQFGPDAA